MAIKLSTGLVNAMMSGRATLKGFISGATCAYADNGASPDSITDSGNGLVTAGFCPGDYLFTKNPTTAGNEIAGTPLLSVAAGTMTFVTGTLAQSEAFPAAGCAMTFRGGSFADTFRHGVIRIFSGTPPATADAAITGSLLIQITVASAAWVAGAFDNGLQFTIPSVLGVLSKYSHVWSGAGLMDGVATHFRFVGNATDANGLSTTLPRIQGTVSTTGADMNMSSTSVKQNATTTIDVFELTLAPS